MEIPWITVPFAFFELHVLKILTRGFGLVSWHILSCKSCFHFILIYLRSPKNGSFVFAKSIWKLVVPAKVKSFVWTDVPNWISASDLIQIWRPLTALSANYRMFCRLSFEKISSVVFELLSNPLVFLVNIGFFQRGSKNSRFNFRGLDADRDVKITRLWSSHFVVVWCTWLERYAHFSFVKRCLWSSFEIIHSSRSFLVVSC